MSITFQCIPGLGPKSEQKIINHGIHQWKDVLTQETPDFLSTKIWVNLQQQVVKLETALKNEDYHFLSQNIRPKMQYRLTPLILQKAAYLDIETTGLSYWNNHVTTIAVYAANQVHTFVHGQNLEEFPDFIAQFPMIVTFFGKAFDIPFLQHEFRNSDLQVPPIHLDVCFLLRRIGLRGGLKRIEHSFGINRGELEGVDGDIGVILWHHYQKTKNSGFLQTLLAYNVEDVMNLEYLLRYAYPKISELDHLPEIPLPETIRTVKNPFQPDMRLLRPILAQYQRPAYDPHS